MSRQADHRDSAPRPQRRPTDELLHRESQRRAARGIGPATVTEPTLHERGRPPGVEPDWIYGGNPHIALIPSVFNAANFRWSTVTLDTISSVTIVNTETGERTTFPIHVAPVVPVEELDEGYVGVLTGAGFTRVTPSGGTFEIAHGSYTPFDGGFDYYGNDPAQWEHGEDGGTPMTVAELLGADEKMDEIDRLLDE